MGRPGIDSGFAQVDYTLPMATFRANLGMS